MIRRLRKYKAVRYVAYALAWVLMVLEEVKNGLIAGHAAWRALAEASERSHAAARQIRLTPAQATSLHEALKQVLSEGWGKPFAGGDFAGQCVTHAPRTIHFRRHQLAGQEEGVK